MSILNSPALRRFKKPMQWVLGVLLGLFLLKTVYMAGSVKGLVLERGTGKPIPGAIVVVAWPKYKMFGSWHGSIQVGAVHVREVLTNERGEFSFWPWIDIISYKYTVGSSSPAVFVAKSGFAPIQMLSNGSAPLDTGYLAKTIGDSHLIFLLAPPYQGMYDHSFSHDLSKYEVSVCDAKKDIPLITEYLLTHNNFGKLIERSKAMCRED